MPVDASIYSQIQQPKPVNQLANMAQALQLQGAVQQNKLAELAMQDRQRGIDTERGVNDAYRTALGPDGGIDRNALYKNLAGGGYGAKLPAIQKGFAEQDKAKLEVDEKTFKLASDRYEKYLGAMGSLANAPDLSKDMVIQAGQQLVQMGILPPEMFQKAVAGLPDDPNQLRMKIKQGTASRMTPEQMMTVFAPKPERIDNGQTIAFQDTNPNSPTYGQATGGAPVQKMQTPDSKASVGASYANAAATREVASATRDAANIRRDQDTEMKLADDYRAQSKPFKEVSDAYKTINATLDKATTSAAATLAGATKFMKLLDPGSVVRESELGMALAATGVFDRATNYVNTLRNGKVLTPSQARDFKDITGKIYQAAQQQQQAIDADYQKKAQQYKLRPEMITQDLGQNAKPAAPALPSGWSVNSTP